jgi:hypothetical protein
LEKFTRVSLTRDQVAEVKRIVTGDAKFADRISLGFAMRLAWLNQKNREDRDVLGEVDGLEQGVPTRTKVAEQFKHSPLWPFWHKHFYSTRHMLRNVGDHWGISRGNGNSKLDAMTRQAVSEQAHDLEMLTKLSSHRFIMSALEERSELTGDWIVFAKHGGNNYYLDLATHEEGKPQNAPGLLAKLRNGSAMDFPFLFDGR